MNETEFINLFSESFDELSTSINLDTPFREIEEWNSMQALILIAHIDDTKGVVLTADDLRNSKTLKDLYNIVLLKL